MHWWQWLGPWPIRPALVAGLFVPYYLTYMAGVLGNQPLVHVSALARWFLPCVILTLVTFGILSLGKRWQQRHGMHWGSYLVTLIAVGLMMPVGRAVGLVPIAIPDDALSDLGLVIRSFLIYSFIMVMSGVVLGRLEAQITATQDALDIAREQQVQILKSDEEARRQVSMLLHDRVQAGLITVCLELRALSRRLPEDDQHDLRAVISQLEAMRSTDVRRAARVLSPNLNEIDLTTSLEELSAQYEIAFHVDLRIDPKLNQRGPERDAKLLLAGYRIIEQALLNVAAHAHAHGAVVTVLGTPDGLELRVEDDGMGPPPEITRGRGSTIITTWVRASNGTWSMEAAQGGRGTVIMARLYRTPTLIE